MSRSDAKYLALLVVGLALGCGGEGDPPITYGPLGSARFVLLVPSSLSTGGVDRVTVTSSRPSSPGSEPRSEPLLGSGGQWSGWMDQLQAVDGYTFVAEGTDGSGTRRFEARVSEVSIPYSRTALVLLTAREPSGSTPTGNVPPFIDTLVASRDVIEPGGRVLLRAQVHDANPDDVFSSSWEATGGTWKDASIASAEWTAPDVEGPQTLTLTVTDTSGAAVSLELTLNVQSRASRDAPVRAVLREHSAKAPSLAELSASLASVGPGEVLRLGAAARVSLGLLSFAWTTSAGTVSAPVSGALHSEVLWVAPSCLPAGVEPTVTVTVSNPAGLSDSRTLPITWTGPTCARPACLFSLEDGRVSLAADCITDTPLFVPNGYIFDGQGHSVTAVDPPAGGHFTGAIIRNRGGPASVRSVTVTASGLKGVCETASAKLRGILLEGASGEVVDTTVSGIHKGLDTSGCQEGIGIEVRNDDASRGPFRVDVSRNHVSGYQKIGILASGAVEVAIDGNTVEGSGPVGHIARNGIQVRDGARGRVWGNTVSGNAYTRTAAVGSGVLVSGGGTGNPLVTGLSIEGNTLTGNDVGIYLFQDAGDPPTPTASARITHNAFRNDSVSNPAYQAAISDYYGTGSVISANQISGDGYDPTKAPDHTLAVDVYTLRPAAKLSILTPEYELATGACSGKVTVQSQDAVGNLVPSNGPFTLNASGSAGSSVTFHSKSDCSGAALTTVHLSDPQAEATFYFKSSQPGTVTVSVSGGGLTSATQDQTIH